MTHVFLASKRNRGWPWPEDSGGLTPMYGADGWCRACGIPILAQSGSMVIQRSTKSDFSGAWLPNLQFDSHCMDERLGEEVVSRFRVRTMAVEWRGSAGDRSLQIVLDSSESFEFDREGLEEAVFERHGELGEICEACGRWKWYPVALEKLPDVLIGRPVRSDVISSSEWFGSGLNAFQYVLFSRPLGELLAARSPNDFAVQAASVKYRN